MSVNLQLQQPSLPGMCAVSEAVRQLAEDSEAGERGAVYTRREVVDFILDLVGYVPNRRLHEQRLLEPSFGAGDFLLPAVDRLLQAWRAAGATAPVRQLASSLFAIELHRETFEATHSRLIEHLNRAGLAPADAAFLSGRWLVQGDFLLMAAQAPFDYVVGNPPYLRQELIPGALLSAYRSRFGTLFDRADLYVPFIEHSLNQLAPAGVLGFICADRWIKNRYGGPLRAMIARDFNLRVHVDMTDTAAFHTEVSAYPAISILARESATVTRIAAKPPIEAAALGQLARALCAAKAPAQGSGVTELEAVTSGSEPWVLEGGGRLALVRRLEREFVPLEQAGCKVGIGVATGADRAFIGAFDELDVEEDRKLPLAMTRDIAQGSVQWQGQGVVNPFRDEGGLVALRDYPRLARYFEARRSVIASRHCAQKSPEHWYRTIDRIWPALARQPKLLIPDIKGHAHVVYEPGILYPHHNLYYVTSGQWNLRALQALLLSNVARLFVATYSTKMRGGFLRFQAQYLRRICLPHWHDIAPELQCRLARAAERGDLAACNEAVALLYRLSPAEESLLEGN